MSDQSEPRAPRVAAAAERLRVPFERRTKVQWRTSEATYERVRSAASETGLALNEIIEDAVSQWLSTHEDSLGK